MSDASSTLLVVADDQARTETAARLRACGAVVHETRNAAEAIEAARRSMPGMAVLERSAAGEADPLEKLLRALPGGDRLLIVALGAPASDACAAAAMAQLVEDGRRGGRSTLELQILHAVAMAFGEADDLESGLRALLSLLGDKTGWAFAAAWLPSEEGDALEVRCLWSLTAQDTDALRPLVPTRIVRGAGITGRAWAEREPVWVPDVREDATVLAASCFERLGLRSMVAIPVLLHGEVVAVLDFFLASPRAADQHVIHFLAAAAAQVASAIRRKRLEEALVRSEEHLRKAQKMEAIARLTGGIAHDFNNLMMVISANAQLLSEQLHRADARSLEVHEIRKAAERAAGLIRQLLAFSRKQVLQPRLVAVDAVVSGMENLLRRMLGDGLRLRCALEAAQGQIFADPGQIEQVILNLAANARDALPHGGELEIATAEVTLDQSDVVGPVRVPAGAYVRISISDNGCGMDAQALRHAFEPFFTTKSSGGRSGLGLSTSYGIVKQSGGYIFVTSAEGKGTRFRIYLPRAAPRHDGARTDPEAKGQTVLLVEDEDRLRAVMEKALLARGYRVLSARGGAEALNLCTPDQEIDLVISDLVLPRMPGAVLAQRLREANVAAPILYISGFVEAERAAVNEAAGFIEKPFTIEALVRKMRGIFDAGGRRA